MAALTQRQRLYAEGRKAGLRKKDAAIAAGCPEGTASQQASRYEKNANVLAHMKRIGFDPTAKQPKNKKVKPKATKPKQKKAVKPKEKPKSKRFQPSKPPEIEQKQPEVEQEFIPHDEHEADFDEGLDEHKRSQSIADKARAILKSKDHSEVSLAYLVEVVIDEQEDPRLRIDCAKFIHKSEQDAIKNQTKKDKTKAGAKEAANRFAPTSPPKLKAVK